MSEQKTQSLSHRLSITQQYGVVGWVVLAAIVGIATVITALAASSANAARTSNHAAMSRSEGVICSVLGDASGAMDHVAFFDDALGQTHPCR